MLALLGVVLNVRLSLLGRVTTKGEALHNAIQKFNDRALLLLCTTTHTLTLPSYSVFPFLRVPLSFWYEYLHEKNEIENIFSILPYCTYWTMPTFTQRGIKLRLICPLKSPKVYLMTRIIFT